MKLKIEQAIMTSNPCYLSGMSCKKIGMQLHTIGCAQGTAASVRSAMNQPGYMAGVHYIVDADVSGHVLQTLPDIWRSWADGGYGNDNLISVEVCESDYIQYTGGANYTVSDWVRFEQDIKRGYNTAVALFAAVCDRYGFNPTNRLPSGLYVVSSHDEGRRAGLSTAHVDPTHVWDRFGLTIDKFRSDIKSAMTGQQPAPEDAPEIIQPDAVYYKVQCGAFTEKANADKLKAELKAQGFDAFVVRINQYYKVQVGAFTVRDNADRLMDRIIARGYPAFVTMTRSATTYSVWVGLVTADVLNVRTGPGTGYSNLLGYPYLEFGNLVDVIGESGDWYQVKIAGTHKGWVSKDYIARA